MTEEGIIDQQTTLTIRRLAPRRARHRWLRPGAIWFAADIVVPTLLVYLLLWAGAGLYLALLASAALSAVSAGVAWWRGTGSQRFAREMLLLALGSLAVSSLTGSDRFLLAKESVLTAAVGVGFLASLRSARPLSYQLTRPLLEGRRGWRSDWERIWEREPRFRHIWRVSTVLWSVVLLADASLRVVIAYTLPVDLVPALQTGLMIATTVLMQFVSWAYYIRAGLLPLAREPWAARQATGDE